MKRRLLSLVAAFIGCMLTSLITAFPTPAFYEGKVIRIIVGYSAGGGFDANARTIARHMGKYIPGNPTLIVENMPGAGSQISANHLYKVAKPDGLTIGHFTGGNLFFNQIMGQTGVEFDIKRFEYIGATVIQQSVCVFTKRSGITSIDKWMASKVPLKMGGMAPGNDIDNAIRMLKAVVGLPIHLVSGYKGTADIRLAAESGELYGGVWDWKGMKMAWRNALEVGDVVVVLQLVPKPLPDLPMVPLAINLCKNEEGRQLIDVGIHSFGVFNWPFALPPGTPKERVEILRKAFQETLRDKEFLAEREKAKMGLDPVTGEEIEKAIERIFKLDPAALDKLKKIFFD